MVLTTLVGWKGKGIFKSVAACSYRLASERGVATLAVLTQFESQKGFNAL